MTASNSTLKVRNVHFNFEGIKKHWVFNSSVATNFINSMHIVFPEGEKFFVRSVRKYAKQLKDEQLKKDVIAFCGQEGIHAREHQNFWEIMETQDLDPQVYAKFLKTTAFSGKFSIENTLIKVSDFFQKGLGDKMALSLTTALEHYTAIMANALFHEPFANTDNIEPRMLELLHWHASEEIEHKAVCFDVLNEVDGNYYVRVSGMVLASIMLWGYIGMGQIYFIAKDKDKSIIKMPFEIYMLIDKVIFGEIGKNLSKHLLDYFKRDFHPNQINDQYLVDNFFKDKTYA
jgi:hypothetical protein